MSSITIRGCCIGAGRPKVILPIVARTEDDILREARRLSALKADCTDCKFLVLRGSCPCSGKCNYDRLENWSKRV